MPKFPKQLFYISADTWRALDVAEVRATVEAMKTLGIYHLPYPVVTVRIAADSSTRMVAAKGPRPKDRWGDRFLGDYDPKTNSYALKLGAGAWLEIADLSLEGPAPRKRLMFRGHPQLVDAEIDLNDPMSNVPEGTEDVAAGLIVLLNTRNAHKHTVEHKCAKLGIGKDDKRYQYVTTITMPVEIDEDHESVRTGATKAPHLRRGHIRHQRHGPKFAFVREIWIEPCFVNADDEWVSKRERYNVSL